ncbi:MAG: BF3164 family lipoprotein [Rikenellaceae bacterium]
MKLLTTILTALCAVSCAQPEYTSIYDMFTEERELKITEEIAISEPLSYISKGVIQDSLFFAQIRQSTHHIYATNIFTGEVESKILPKGRGRGEAMNISLLGLVDNDIVCFSWNNRSAIRVDLNEAIDSTNAAELRSTKWKSDDKIMWANIIPLPYEKYISNQFTEDGIFHILDSDLEELCSFQKYEKVSDSDMENNSTYQGLMYLAPSKDRFIHTSYLINNIHIYDVTSLDSEPRLVKHYKDELPKFELKSAEYGEYVEPLGSNILGTGALTASNKHFYLLNIGLSYDEFRALGDEADEGATTILVFDRDGRPVEKLILERPATDIYYSETNNSLYTIGINDREEDCLIRYEL